MIAFSDEIRRNGFNAGDPLTVGPCEIHQRHHYSIDPQGHIYKCPGFLGKSEWAVGHVESGLNARWERMASLNPMRECGSCSHRPDCGGGCLAAKWTEAGRVEGVNCEIPFFDKWNDELLKRRWAITVSGDFAEAQSQLPRFDVDIPAPAVLQRRPVGLRVINA
jgi:uncharacterized protein